MSNGREMIGDTDLLSYVDGQLDEDSVRAVERFLADNPEKAAEVEAWLEQAKSIKALYGNVTLEPIPDRLDAQRLAHRHRSARTRFWQMAAAACLVAGLGIGAGWLVRDAAGPANGGSELLIAEAVNAHSLFVKQRRHPVEVPAAESAHLNAWLSGSLERSFSVPDLNEKGFSLVGGRLLPASTGPAAQIMYEDGGERRLTLFITARADGTPAADRFETGTEVAALYWANDAVTCTIVGAMSRAEIESLAGDVFAAFNAPEDPYFPG